VDPESAVRSLSLDEELPPFLAVPDASRSRRTNLKNWGCARKRRLIGSVFR
jgi:hypothetical protein